VRDVVNDLIPRQKLLIEDGGRQCISIPHIIHGVFDANHFFLAKYIAFFFGPEISPGISKTISTSAFRSSCCGP